MRYSKLTNEQKQKLIESYKRAIILNGGDEQHAAAIAAGEVLGHNGKVNGSDIQADRWAAALTYLIFSGYIQTKNDRRVPREI